MTSVLLRPRALVLGLLLWQHVALGSRSAGLEGDIGGKNSFQVVGPGRDFESLLGENPTTAEESGTSNARFASPAASSFLQQEGADLSDLFRMSVVRIMSITKPVNFFQPFFPGGSQQAVGSGFAVEPGQGKPNADDPIFVTNAHVVRNAHTVQIQLPAMGLATFDAYVPLIYDDFDLAIVRLAKPKEFLQAIAAQNFSLKILPIATTPVTLGLEVVAVGFPLGSDSLKLSRGVIAGTEQVSGGVCYQSTAPISPGNSGGPLFSLGTAETGKDPGNDLSVIGVNFAASVSGGAQNINYVIAIVHIQQILNGFSEVEKEHAEMLKKIAKEGERIQKLQKTLLKRIGEKLPKGVNVKVSLLPDGGIALQLVPGEGMTEAQVQALQEQVKQIATEVQQEMEAQDAHPSDAAKGSKVDSGVVKGDASGGNGSLMQAVSFVVFPNGTEVTEATPEATETTHQDPQNAMPPPHYRLRIAPIDMMGTEGNDALYQGSGEEGHRCEKGIYISKIGQKSALRSATDDKGVASELPEGAFLTAVNGFDLDSFGMARTKYFLGDPLPFESIMGIGERIEDPVKLTVCKAGVESVHTISMVWKESYDTGIKGISEPYFEPEALDYEHFADITVMQMTQNHLLALLKAGSSSLGRLLTPENQDQPWLLVVDVKQGSYAGRNVMPGMLIEKINGIKVSTLAEYRGAFEPNGTDFWTLETDRGVLIQQYFEKTLAEQVQLALQVPEFRYLVTPAVRKAAQDRAAAQQGGAEALAAHAADAKAAMDAMHNQQVDDLKNARDGENKPRRDPKLVSHPESFLELAPLLKLLPEAPLGARPNLQGAAYASLAGPTTNDVATRSLSTIPEEQTGLSSRIGRGLESVPQSGFLRMHRGLI